MSARVNSLMKNLSPDWGSKHPYSTLAGYASDNSADSLLSTSTSKPVNQHRRRLRNAGILLQLDSRARQRESSPVGRGPWESRFDAKNIGKQAGRSVSTGRCPVGGEIRRLYTTSERRAVSVFPIRESSGVVLYNFTTNMRARDITSTRSLLSTRDPSS